MYLIVQSSLCSFPNKWSPELRLNSYNRQNPLIMVLTSIMFCFVTITNQIKSTKHKTKVLIHFLIDRNNKYLTNRIVSRLKFETNSQSIQFNSFISFLASKIFEQLNIKIITSRQIGLLLPLVSWNSKLPV